MAYEFQVMCPACKAEFMDKEAMCCTACMTRLAGEALAAAYPALEVAWFARHGLGPDGSPLPPPVPPCKIPDALANRAAAMVRAQLDWGWPRARKRQLGEGQILALFGTAQRRGRAAWTCIRMDHTYGRNRDDPDGGHWSADSDFVQVAPLRDGTGWLVYATRQQTLRTYTRRYCEHTDELLAERKAWPIQVEIRNGTVTMVREHDKARVNAERAKAAKAAEARKAVGRAMRVAA